MDDWSFPEETRRPLVRMKKSRGLNEGRRFELSSRGKAFYKAIPAPVKTASRHSVWLGTRALVACIVFLFLAVGTLYCRLLFRPISFAFLVPQLENRLNSELDGYSFHFGDAILRLAPDWGFEFRLTNVSLVDDNNQEIAKAPLAALDISERALLTGSLAASKIELIGPKILIFNLPGKGLALTSSPDVASPQAEASSLDTAKFSAETHFGWKSAQEPPEIAGIRGMARQALETQPSTASFNPAPFLNRLFAAVEERGGASAIRRIGFKDGTVYFANDKSVTTWHLSDLHVALDEENGSSVLRGEIALQRNQGTWRASFSAIHRRQDELYTVRASLDDVIPRSLWHSGVNLQALKTADFPVSGEGRLDISHSGRILGADGSLTFGAGRIFAPFDEKHPASIEAGLLKVSYDGPSETIHIDPLELRWDDSASVLKIAGAIARKTGSDSNKAVWLADLNGRGTKLGASDFGVHPIAMDSFRLTGGYDMATDSVTLNDFHIQSGNARIAFAGRASSIHSNGSLSFNGTMSPMPFSFLKAVWPVFAANGARDWLGSNVPVGQITGGSIAVELSMADIAALDDGGDIPDEAVNVKMGVSGAQIYHIKGLPPIMSEASMVSVRGRHFAFDIPTAHVDVPSGKSISFSEGQLLIDDIRPEFPDGEIRFKAAGDVSAVLELIDQPPLNYVKAVGFKPIVNGHTQTAFQIKFPVLKDLKFKQMSIAGKARVSDLKSNGLPAGLAVNGGAVAFDVSESAISANGDIKVNGVPVTIAWQRIFDAPPEKQPALRLAAILNERGRDDLGLNVNHIVKGDLPVALAIAMQRDAPPRLFAEANLTNADVFLTAIGWRKPPGQRASVNFDLTQRSDNSLALDNFVMTGDGIAIDGHVVFNDKHRLAGFSFPDFSLNALTHLSVSGELTSQNILKVHAKGESFDGRSFFRSLLTAGKIAENEPAALNDEPGLDLNVEVDTVIGHYDTTLKSVIVSAKRRQGKLTFLEVAGRLNGEAPVAVHIDQRGHEPRMLISDATDAGAAFRLVGFYPAMHGGTMNLRINLDGVGGADKTGVLDVRRFVVTGDEILGKVVSQAEKEGARRKPESRPNQRVASGATPMQFDRMVVPFSVGGNLFRLHDAAINGPVLGATLRGSVDFPRDTINLSGTYVPLYGFNSVLGNVPLLGELLKGRENEGVFGITFAVHGKTSNPDVVVNPVSMLAPGFLRQIFEFEQSPVPQAPQQKRPPAQVDGNG